MSTIYFIIGASGSGKTACLASLKALLPEFIIHDFDSIGVAQNADTKWRQQTTEKWIKKLCYAEQSHPVCLLGQMVPAEIFCSHQRLTYKVSPLFYLIAQMKFA